MYLVTLDILATSYRLSVAIIQEKLNASPHNSMGLERKDERTEYGVNKRQEVNGTGRRARGCTVVSRLWTAKKAATKSSRKPGPSPFRFALQGQ